VRALAVGAHVPAASAAATVLASTPPVAVVADIDEIATWSAVAARQGGKAVRVLAQVALARAGRTAASPAFLRLQIPACRGAIVRA